MEAVAVAPVRNRRESVIEEPKLFCDAPGFPIGAPENKEFTGSR